MILKQLIRYTNADALEATWVRYDQLPDVDVPASPALYDADGKEVIAAVEAHTVSGEVIETVLRCHAYSNGQMAMLRADLGDDAATHEALIAEVEATYVEPEPTPLVDRQAAAWDRIKTERDRRKYLGVKVGAHWFHSDDPSRIQQLALAMMGNAIPAGLQWKTLTLSPPPVFVVMTPALAQGIFQSTAASDAAIFTASEAHRVAMEASDTPEGYDFSGGWPASIEDDV